MTHVEDEYAYLSLLARILATGEFRDDRTGVGSYSVHAPQLRFDSENGFPLLTTKHVSARVVKRELFWMLNGDTNVRTLNEQGVHIWDEWAGEDGDLGPVYGAQWRRWHAYAHEIDQIGQLITGLQTNPNSRRHIVSAWNVAYIDEMALPPCHCFFQCFYHRARAITAITRPVGGLSLHMYQRSADMFLGVPYNIASYALLLSLLARVTNLEPRELVISFGDAHVYKNHIDQVEEQLTRDPDLPPTLEFNDNYPLTPDLRRLDPRVVKVIGYKPQAAIRAEVAV